jgi:hypothetical protein
VKFGRFEFGKIEPMETYEGDYMAMERGYVRIFNGEPAGINPPRLLAAIRLDRGQRCVRSRQELNARNQIRMKSLLFLLPGGSFAKGVSRQ